MKLFKALWNHPVIKMVGIILLAEYICTMLIIPKAEGWSFFDSTWWFVVTVTTVGYGDLSNATVIGRLWGMCVILSGVFCMASLGGTLLELLIERRNNKMRGDEDYSEEKGHIVIMAGKCTDTITHLVDTLLADKLRKDRTILICSNEIGLQPDPRALFVRGEATSDDVMHRSGIAEADRVIIHTGSDHENVFIAMAIAAADDDDPVHMVVHLADANNAKHLERVNTRNNISTVIDFSADLIVRESQDKGTASIIHSLASNNEDGHNIYRVPIERGPCWGKIKEHFKDHYGDKPEVILLGAELFSGKHVIGAVPSDVAVAAVLAISPERITIPVLV